MIEPVREKIKKKTKKSKNANNPFGIFFLQKVRFSKSSDAFHFPMVRSRSKND